MPSLIRRFAADCRGIIHIEFAVILPVLVAVLLGGFEASRYMLIGLKLDRAATSIADVVAQQTTLTGDQVMDLLAAGVRIVDPFDLCEMQDGRTVGNIVITGVGLLNGTPQVMWQRRIEDGTTVISTIGDQVGGPGSLPTGLTLTAQQDRLVAAEVFYNYKPVFGGNLFPPKLLTSRAFSRPRETAVDAIVTPESSMDPCA